MLVVCIFIRYKKFDVPIGGKKFCNTHHMIRCIVYKKFLYLIKTIFPIYSNISNYLLNMFSVLKWSSRIVKNFITMPDLKP